MAIDNRTTGRNYPLPHPSNLLAEDVQRLRDALNAIDADVLARYTKTEVDQLIANLINGAPGALNTLDELAAALGDDANFAATVTNILALKANLSDVWTRTQADARYVQGVTQTENVFTGNGTQTAFTLTQAPPTRESLLVTVDGVVQPVSEYSLSGTSLTLSEAPASGAKIRVLMLGVAGPMQSASTLSFAQAGTGAVTRTVQNKLQDVVSVLDFGAIADGNPSGTGTDNTIAFQRAIDTGKTVHVPAGTYNISGTLQLLNGYKALIGDETLPGIIKTTAGPAIKIGATGANLNEFSRLENFYLWNIATPTFPADPGASDAGVVISGADATVSAAVQNAKVYNIRVRNWSAGFFITDVVNCRVEGCFVQIAGITPPSGLTAANKFIGFCIEAVPFTPGGISPLASLELVDNDVTGVGSPSSVTSAGYYVVGSDIRDIFFDRCETASTSYGWWIVATGNDFNWDVQIRRPIVDAYKTHGIYITGADGPGCISIDGGYFVGTGASAGAAIYGVSSSGITVTGGCQILGIANNNSSDDGVRLDACYSCSVVGNSFQNCNYAISLNSSNNCTAVGNHIFASATDTEANPALYEAIRVFGTSEENVIASNTIRGKDATDRYELGITVASGAPRNVVVGNSVDEATVQNAYAILNQTATVVSSDASVISSNTVALRSNNASLSLQGNSGTFPILFRDGGGNIIGKINNSGVYSAGAP